MAVAVHPLDVTGADPTVVRTLVVTTDDLVTALETNERRSAGAVLRVTPPFSGRMRARLHVEREADDYDPPEPVHVPPARLLESIPTLPTPDDTEDAIRADPSTTYSPELHRRRHATALERWRATVRKRVTDRATIETTYGEADVEIRTLG